MKTISKIIYLSSVILMGVLPLSAADILFTCAATGIGDQDDMCIWLHPDDPSQSLIITADKDVWKLFVYTLDGEEQSTYALPHRPGNIDIIYNFPLDGDLVDIIAFNTRSENNARFGFYKINRTTLELDSLGYPMTNNWSDELYGFTLYQSPSTGIFYAFGSDKSSLVQQYSFFDNGVGGIALEHKRTWQNGSRANPTEGMVADQENGLLYAANENEGIDVDGADEDQSTDHVRFLGLNPGTLDDDVEGITIYYAAGGQGYLIASSQGKNYFSVFERADSNAFVGTFRIGSVEDTDGIDVLSFPLNANFQGGIFACHNDKREPQHVELVSWEDIADDLDPGLAIDTSYWDPRAQSTGTINSNKKALQINIFPNPTQNFTEISFNVPATSRVRCELYDSGGRLITRLADEIFSSGKQAIRWNGRFGNTKGSGLVYCHLKVGVHSVVRKIVVL